MIARVELRLNDEEWLDLSYRQLMLLRDRWLALRWQDQWQQGAAIAAIHNNGMRSYKTPPKPDDFVFTIVPGQKRKTSRTNNAKRMTKARKQGIADLFRSVAFEHSSLCPDQSTLT